MPARLIAILLLFCSCAMNLSDLFVVAGFEMNKDFIAKELCVNKDKPQLHCNGKCYLAKKLKQAVEKEQKQEHQIQKIQLQQPVFSVKLEFKQYAYTEIQIHIPRTTGMPSSQVNTVFHPPQQNA